MTPTEANYDTLPHPGFIPLQEVTDAILLCPATKVSTYNKLNNPNRKNLNKSTL
jgi:hypothetical protein